MDDTKDFNKKNENAKDITQKGVVGILNMGNTCYVNSTIQLLRASPEWNSYCVSTNFNELFNNNIDNNYKRVLYEYQDILKALWTAYKPAYIRPARFISEIKKIVKGTVYESFGIPIPNDSHEYLVYLLDNFHEALNNKSEIEPINNPNMDMNIMAKNGWNEFISKNNSPITDIFFGMTRKTIECESCNNKSYKWEVFNSLKIPCEGISFMEWIQNECKQDQIDGYSCDKCNSKTIAKIYTHLWKLPSNLFITLRRFTFDGRKNMTHCPYNGEHINFKDLFAEESSDESKNWEYKLQGISDHHGSHLGGHYTAQLKHPITQEWWWIDDDKCHKIDEPKYSGSNYIYLFRKV
jgi:ubiquitin C-terminal hydrolase